MSTNGRQGSVRRRHTRSCASRNGGRCRCSGSWQYRARLATGKRVEQGGFETKEDAEKALRDLLGEVDLGTYRDRPEPTTFREYAKTWLRQVKPSIRRSTHVSYTGHVNTHLVPYFGDVLLTAITTDMVMDFVAAKAEAIDDKGEPEWSPATIRNMLVTLKMVLSAAVVAKHLAINPAETVKPPKREDDEVEILDDDELDRVLAKSKEPWRTIFDVLSWTGLRRGELLAARWGDVDLEAGRLYIRRSRGRYGEGAPKSKAGRRPVPLTPGVVALLRAHRIRQAPSGDDDDGYMFTTKNATPIDGDNLTRAWTAALRRAGVRHVPLHALRHLGLSRMISAGGSIKVVQKVGGHSSPMQTLKTYGHLLPDDLDALAASMAKMSGGSKRDPNRVPTGTTSEHLDDSQDTSDGEGGIVVAMRVSGQ